jgi:hypothetical protein
VIGFAQINNFRVPTSYPGYFPHSPEDGEDDDESSSGGGSVFRLFGPLDPLMNDRPWNDITTIYWMMGLGEYCALDCHWVRDAG